MNAILAMRLSSFYLLVVLAGLTVIHAVRYYRRRTKIYRLPEINEERGVVISKVEEATGIKGIRLLVDNNARVANLYSISWRRPVIIVTGLANEALSDDEMAATVSHEIGHYVHKDPLKKRVFFIIDAIFFASVILASVPQLRFPLLFTLLLMLIAILFLVFQFMILALFLPKRLEASADDYCVENGFGSLMISSLRKLYESNSPPSRLPKGIIRSHPDLENRIRRIEEKMAVIHNGRTISS